MKLKEYIMKHQTSEHWKLQVEGRKKYPITISFSGDQRYGYEMQVSNRQEMKLKDIRAFADTILKWTEDMEKEMTLS